MLEWDDATMLRGIATVAERHPDRPALVFDEERTTYAELIAESEALESALSEFGVGAGAG